MAPLAALRATSPPRISQLDPCLILLAGTLSSAEAGALSDVDPVHPDAYFLKYISSANEQIFSLSERISVFSQPSRVEHSLLKFLLLIKELLTKE